MTITSCGNSSRTANKENDNYEAVKESLDTAVHKTVDGVHKGADWVEGAWQDTKEGVVDGVHAVGDAVTDGVQAVGDAVTEGVDEVKAEVKEGKDAKEIRKTAREERREARRKRNERKEK